jgi:hypothetical protein
MVMHLNGEDVQFTNFTWKNGKIHSLKRCFEKIDFWGPNQGADVRYCRLPLCHHKMVQFQITRKSIQHRECNVTYVVFMSS